MAESSDTMNIIVRLRDQISRTLKKVNKEMGTSLPRAIKKANMGFGVLKTKILAVKSKVFGLTGMIAALGLGLTAKGFLDVAASFEAMEIKLDVLTKGKGKETLEELNEWALRMPVNTQEAVASFTRMMAMGLDPTIDKLATLVDVASIFGDDVLSRVSRQLGQMASSARISAEDLNTIAETGLNVRKYLTEAFGSIEDLQKKVRTGAIDVKDAINVIWKGMSEEYAGAAAKAQKTWRGLWNTFVSFLVEIQRKIMDAGIFEELKTVIGEVNVWLEKWLKSNKELIKVKVPEWIAKVKKGLETIWKVISYDPAILHYGLLGLAVFGHKGAVAIGGIMHLKNVIAQMGVGLSLVTMGLIKLSDFAKADFKELEALILGADIALKKMGGVRYYKIKPEVEEEVEEKDIVKKKKSPKPVKIQTLLAGDISNLQAMGARLLEQLDYIYEQGTIKAEEYYTKKKELLIESFEDELTILEKLKSLEPDLTKKYTIEKQIQAKRAVLHTVLLQLERSFQADLKTEKEKEVQNAKDVNEEILQQRETMYDALKWKAEGYLEYRIGLLVKEIAEFSKHTENENLIAEYSALRKKELLDEYLQNTNDGYALLVNMSQRTAEAMEQSFSDYFFDLMSSKFDTWRERLYGLLLGLRRIVADVLGQIAREWLVAGAKKLFSMRQETVMAQQKIAQLMQEKIATIALTTIQGAQIGVVSALTSAYMALAVAKVAAGAAAGGGAAGGSVEAPAMMAGGGKVLGYSPTSKSDNILARLTAGEFVHPVDVVKKYGVDVMEGLRKKIYPKEMFQSFNMRLPKSVSVPVDGYATGGLVTPDSKRYISVDMGRREEQAITIINVIDPGEFDAYLATPSGQDAVLNVISSNQDRIQRIER